MATVVEVTTYVTDNILHSSLYESATDTMKSKAVNQSLNMLVRYLDVYEDKTTVPVEDVAEQALWLLKMDDTMQRVEMGATSISVDGISISFEDKDRTIAPAVLAKYGRRTSKRVKVGSYSRPNLDTFRGLY